jgi:hypothetical protein
MIEYPVNYTPEVPSVRMRTVSFFFRVPPSRNVLKELEFFEREIPNLLNKRVIIQLFLSLLEDKYRVPTNRRSLLPDIKCILWSSESMCFSRCLTRSQFLVKANQSPTKLSCSCSRHRLVLGNQHWYPKKLVSSTRLRPLRSPRPASRPLQGQRERRLTQPTGWPSVGILAISGTLTDFAVNVFCSTAPPNKLFPQTKFV